MKGKISTFNILLENKFLEGVRPYFIIAKVCGLFPVKNLFKKSTCPSFDKRNIMGFLLSTAVLFFYAFIVFSFNYRYCVEFSYNDERKLESYTILVSNTILTFQLFIGLSTFIHKSGKLCELFDQFKVVDFHFKKLDIYRIRESPGKIFLLTYLLAIPFLASGPTYRGSAITRGDKSLPRMLEMAGVMTVIIVYLLPNALYFLCLHAIYCRFKVLNKKVKKACKHEYYSSLQVWNDIRISYGLMHKTISIMNQCWGMYLMITLVACFGCLIINIFVLISTKFTDIVSFVGYIFFCLSFLGIITVNAIATEVSISKGKESIGDLECIGLRGFDQNPISNQILLILSVIEKPYISAGSFFNVKSGIITSIASAVCTYVVILIQFNFDTERDCPTPSEIN